MSHPGLVNPQKEGQSVGQILFVPLISNMRRWNKGCLPSIQQAPFVENLAQQNV